LGRAQTAFIAYPSDEPIITDAIREAVEQSTASKLKLIPWEKLPIIGLKVDDLIRDRIAECDVLLADITYSNFNVYYELGFAIALDKPIIPLINTSVNQATRRAQDIGIFDTTGWLTYENSENLIDQLKNWEKVGWTERLRKDKDHSQPMFVLDTLVKSNYRNYVFSEIANNKVEIRSFDPSENPRMTASHAIGEVSSSAGIVVMLLSQEMADWHKNNLRSAFLAGLAHGFDIDPLILQFDNGPAPLDYRDLVKNTNRRVETERHVEEYCREVLIRNQRGAGRARRYSFGVLSRVNLGASAAENEGQQLADYFITTAEFSRARRAEGAIVVGRKGSGKSAIAIRASAESSRDHRALVLDLRPAAHNLSDLREQLLGTVGQGLFDHTIASFWQYVLLIEMLLAARERALKTARSDYGLQEELRTIETRFALTDEIVAGDFTARLEATVELVLRTLAENPTPDEVRQQITNQMYEDVIPELRDAILSLSSFFTDIVILLDDLDKGWPPRRLEVYDVRMLRHLVEVLKRLQRDFRRRDITIKYMMFVRSDVYDILVEETADRGKDNVIKVDWSDRVQLAHLLRERVITSFDGVEGDEAWEAFNVTMPDQRHAVDHLIDASLFRPRFLIEVAERVLSFAINRGHGLVDPDDVEHALDQMSLYLVSDFAYEMRNVAGTPEDIFYAFIGTTELMTHAEVAGRIQDQWPDMDADPVIDLLIWYGFLGVVGESSQPVFIYDRAYDFKRLLAERPAEVSERLYSVNVAFTRGLQPSSAPL
jgi:hypothetical protein